MAELRYYQALLQCAIEGVNLRQLLGRPLAATICIDAKLACDALTSHAVNKNKRCHLELALIREDLRQNRHSLRWIDTRYMLADPLTKLEHHGVYLREVLRDGVCVRFRWRRPLWRQEGARELAESAH